MQKSLKKISRKSLSLLIALIMVISAVPFSPLSSPIEADAAEVKVIKDVWDASRAPTNTNTGQYRYSYADSKTGKTLSGIQWGSLTHNSTYLTVSNTALSFAEISDSGEITGNDNIADLGISGNKWSFSAKFAYRGSGTKTTVFGLASTTKRDYTQKNTGGSPEISNGYVADLVDIRADGTVYIGNNWTAVSGITSSDLVATSATSPITLTVTYDNGNLTIDINGIPKISQTVDAELFRGGVGNYIAGPNVQVFAGANSGIYPHYRVTNNGAYLYNMNLYSLSGATYEGESASESSEITNHGNLTLHWLASEDYTNDASKNTYDINSTSDVTWETTDNVPSLKFKGRYGNSSVKRSFDQTISSTGISSSIESNGAGVTIAFMAYTNNQYDVPFFTIYGDKTEFSYAPSGRILYRNSSYSSSNSDNTQNLQKTDPISTGTWHKIIIVLKSAKSMDVYVDNSTAIKSISNNAFYDNNTWATTHTIKLGASKDGTEKFNGAIRDFRIYNKSLTTSADITSLLSDMDSNKANTKSYNVSAVSECGVLGQSQPAQVRLQNGKMTIANDGYAGNTTIGILRIPLSDFETGDMAGSESKLLLNVSSTWFAEGNNSSSSNTYYSRYANDLYTDVYYTTNDVSSYVSSSGTRSALNTIALDTNHETSKAKVKSNVALLGASDATKIGSIPHTTIGQYSLGIADAINATLNANKKDLYIILVKNAVDGYGNNENGPWTDTYFLTNQQVISYTKVRNYSFVNAAGDKLREVKASSATEAAEYIPTEVTPTRYEPPISILLLGHTKYTYSWPDSPTNDIFREIETPITETCDNEFVNPTSTTHQTVCKLCGFTQTQDHVFQTTSTVQSGDVDNGYTVKTCSSCNYSKNEYISTDWSVYDAQKKVLDDLLKEGSKFSPASLAECQTAYDNAVVGVRSGDETKSQTFIDNKINDLIAAKDLLKSTVTFKVYDDSVGGSPRLLTTESFDVKYLDSKQLDVPNDYSTEYAVTSWKRNINGVDSQIATNTSSILAVVSTNITYMVYLKKTTVDENQASSKAVITLNNKSNKVVDVAYVEKNSGVEVTVDVDNGSITVGGQTLKAPTYSFYRVTGFKINGKTVNTGTIDITGDFIIKPEYEARTSFIITGGNGVVEKSTTTSWDKRVRLTAETPAQSGKINEWTSTINNKTVVWGYGDTLSFQATQACTVECAEVDATEFDGAEDVKLSVDYVSYNLYRANSITAISRVVAPEGTVLEYGTILKTANIKAGATNANYETQKAAVNNKDNYKVENKSGVFKATQKISNTDQFAYNFYSAQDYDKMYVGAVAYAKLSNGTTVYSDVVTYEVR